MTLPINECLPALLDALNHHHQAVLQAPPGAGKTTQVPLALLNQPWLGHQKIVVLEPRRVAALNAATRMASLLGEPVGQTVGYRMRQANKTSAQTRIEVVTEGLLTRWLQTDPELTGVGAILFDEFHERSINTDVGLALCLQARELFRDPKTPLKLLIMSATLDGDAIAQLLKPSPDQNVPIITSQGRCYPVTMHYLKTTKSLHKPHDFLADLLPCIQHAISQEAGSILVFLPGAGEITRTQQALSASLGPHISCHPLHGSLSLDEQKAAIMPAAQGTRKIVLATDIAETSLTIEGVRVVIDTGLTRTPAFDPNTGLTRLHTQAISQASAEQRAGRAGRTEPGSCYRLWREAEQTQKAKFTAPEILSADLMPLAVTLLQWGVNHPSELLWLNPIPEANWQQALSALRNLGALNDNGQLNHLGESLNQYACHPRLARLLIAAQTYQAPKLGALLAAILSERTPKALGSNLADAVSAATAPKAGPHKAWQNRVQQLAKQWVPSAQKDAPSMHTDDLMGLLVAVAFPERIAKQKNTANNMAIFQLANGRAVQVALTEAIAHQPWLSIADAGGIAGKIQDTIFSAVNLNPTLFDNELAPLTHAHTLAEWCTAKNRFIAEEQIRIGHIIIRSKKNDNLPSTLKVQALKQLIQQKGLGLLNWDEDTQQLRARLALAHSLYGDPWPKVDDETLINTLDNWLTPELATINTLNDFKKINIAHLLNTLLPWALTPIFNADLPTSIAIPSGRQATINYLTTPPVLAVKLQEMFGCKTTPTIAKGRISLILHLLSPAKKPLQVTQDLASFWANSYTEVKKEMRGRYPKHPWPDDPLSAQATELTKKKMQHIGIVGT